LRISIECARASPERHGFAEVERFGDAALSGGTARYQALLAAAVTDLRDLELECPQADTRDGKKARIVTLPVTW
jgi:hypothetical protein